MTREKNGKIQREKMRIFCLYWEFLLLLFGDGNFVYFGNRQQKTVIEIL